MSITDGAFLAAVAALAGVLLLVLADWRRRDRLWRSDPERLLEPSPRRTAWCVAALLLSAGGFATDVRTADLPSAWTALSASLTWMIVGHRREWLLVSGVGLAMCVTAVAAASAWILEQGSAAPVGVAIAGLWAYWAARFWRQQRHGPTAWTTTGRLAPTAMLLAAACSLAVGWSVLHAAPRPISSAAWIVLAAQLAHAALATGEAMRRRLSSAAACAALAAAASGVAAWRVAAN